MQRRLENRRKAGRLFDQVVALQQIQRGQAGGTGYRVSGIGVAMSELSNVLRSRLVHKGVVDFARSNDCAQRYRTVSDLFSRVHDVRDDAEVLRAGPFTHAAKSSDDFIEDQ
ncbi:hypothetical protein D3C75_891940 [compost metagenome]